MAKNVGTLIREARTAAGLSQAALAKQVGNLTSADLSKAERGEKSLTAAQLKQLAKILGIAQTTLLNAPEGGVSSGSSSSSSSSSSNSLKLSKTEKELILLYRAANDETRKKVLELLTPQNAGNDLANVLISALGGGNANGANGANGGADLLGSLLGGSSGSSGNASSGGSLLGSLLGGGSSSGSSAGGDLLGALLNATSTNTADDDDNDNNQGGGLLGGLLNLLSGK